MPFVPATAVCRFRSDGKTRDWALAWRSAAEAEIEPALDASCGRVQRRLDASVSGELAWWISIPDMGDTSDWAGFYGKIERNLADIRAAGVVVIDLRGNGGGSSVYGEKLASLLWGDALVAARWPGSGPTVWRASKANRDYWVDLTARMSENPNLSAGDKAAFDSILKDFDRALAGGEPTFRRGETGKTRAPAHPPNPVSGRVVLLTDYACDSACLDLMDLFTAMPNTTQAGTMTSADTIFMELTVIPSLPSTLSGFGFGHKAWIERPRPSNRPYRPTRKLTWHGSPDDDAGERKWLLESLR